MIRISYVGVYCVYYFFFLVWVEEGVFGWFFGVFVVLFLGRVWYVRVCIWDRDVLGFGGDYWNY